MRISKMNYRDNTNNKLKDNEKTMKRFMFGAVIVLALLMTVSCNKETSPENRILGTWGLVQERVHYEDADPSDGIDVRPDEVYSYEPYAFQYRFGDYGVLY